MNTINRPIRILHMIASLELGGSQSYVMNQYRKIDREKVQFDFIVDHTRDMFLQNEIQALGGRVYVMPTFRGINIYEIIRAWNLFFKEHPEYNVIHSHSRSYASIYLSIAKKYGVKTIIHSHSTSNGKGIRSLVKSILQFPLRYQADYFLACSKKAGEWLFGKKVCSSCRFKVIKNAIDAKRFQFSEKIRNESRLDLGIGSEFVLGYLARVTEPKNPHFVIDVFAELVKIIPNAKLLFVGDGVLLQSVKKKAVNTGVISSVIFTGSRTDTERMLFAMDCYILSSVWEGLGISLIEAQASGLRCICSENIQAEAIVTDLVDQHNLSEGALTWAEHIADNAKAYIRTDQYVNIINAGYDLSRNILPMIELYQGLIPE